MELYEGVAKCLSEMSDSEIDRIATVTEVHTHTDTHTHTLTHTHTHTHTHTPGFPRVLKKS